MELFDNTIPLSEKRITAEVCIHHLWFNEDNYKEKGTYIKWNPAVKKESDRSVLFEALLNDKLDVITTIMLSYYRGKIKYLSQNLLRRSFSSTYYLSMLEFYKKGKISLEKIVEKMCHNPAILFQVVERGYIKEGYYADLVLVDLDQTWESEKR